MKLIVAIALLLGIVVWSYADYKAPTAWVKVSDRVATNVGQEVELVARTAMVDVLDEDGAPTGEKVLGPNPLFVKQGNASFRVCTKDKDEWEVVWRLKGNPASEIVVATGTSACKAEERQAVFIRVRSEEPSMNQPTDPTIEVQP